MLFAAEVMQKMTIFVKFYNQPSEIPYGRNFAPGSRLAQSVPGLLLLMEFQSYFEYINFIWI